MAQAYIQWESLWLQRWRSVPGEGFFCSLSGRYVDWLLVEKNYASAVSYDYSQWGVGFLPQLVMPASLLRIFVTGVCTEIVLITLTWLFLFDRKERDVIMMKLKIYMNKVTGNAATCTAKPL